MAHFAKIEDGFVTEVIVVENELCGGGSFPESEQIGQAYIASLGISGEWKQTSYNTSYVYEYETDDATPPNILKATIVGSQHSNGGTPFRGTYAGIGMRYDKDEDVFVPVGA
jgi:hypothetical protein